MEYPYPAKCRSRRLFSVPRTQLCVCWWCSYCTRRPLLFWRSLVDVLTVACGREPCR